MFIQASESHLTIMKTLTYFIGVLIASYDRCKRGTLSEGKGSVLSTLSYLLVQNNCFYSENIIFLLYKTSHLNEVNHTEPSTPLRVPW